MVVPTPPSAHAVPIRSTGASQAIAGHPAVIAALSATWIVVIPTMGGVLWWFVRKDRANAFNRIGKLELAAAELKSKVESSLKELVATGVVAKVQLIEAEAATRESQIRLKSAQQALANLGLPMSIDDICSGSRSRGECRRG